MVKNKTSKLYLFLIYLFLYAPIIVLVIFSFNESRLRGSFSGFSLKWYSQLFRDRQIMAALYNTLFVAVISTIVSTILGTISAIGIYYSRGFKKELTLNLNYLPVINPDIVTGISLMALFKFLSIKLGMSTMIISHIVFSTPYVILSILPKMNQLDKNLIDAAMDLGAKPLYAMVNVIIPQIRSGIITGALMALTLSIDDFVISYFNTGHGFSNLSITIYSMAKKGINPSINALSTLMFAFLFGLLLIINKRTKEEEIE